MVQTRPRPIGPTWRFVTFQRLPPRAPAAIQDRNNHPRPVRFDPDTRRHPAPTSIMKNRPKKPARPAAADKIKALKLKIAAAEKRIAASRRRARTAKASFKRARKTFKQAKKTGKAARRSLQPLREALSQAEQEARKSPAVGRKRKRTRSVRPHVAAKPRHAAPPCGPGNRHRNPGPRKCVPRQAPPSRPSPCPLSQPRNP